MTSSSTKSKTGPTRAHERTAFKRACAYMAVWAMVGLLASTATRLTRADEAACVPLAAGISVDETTGSIVIVGQVAGGSATGGGITARLGASTCLLAARGGTTVPDIPGDFDRDGDVDLADYLILQKSFTGPDVPTPRPRTDLDRDGDTDLADMIVFQAAFTGSI